MIILDKPYVSELLAETLSKRKYPVLRNEVSEKLSRSVDIELIDSREASDSFRNGEFDILYSNSENSLAWVSENLGFSSFSANSAVFKDKYRFRKETEGIFGPFSCREVGFAGLSSLDVSEIKKPFIIKPSVGFFSLGVYRVDSDIQWPEILESILESREQFSSEYPEAVIDAEKFIIEEFIEGEEYAIDAYFDRDGSPVILNILHHIFSSGSDVKDRVYNTSADIISEFLPRFTEVLARTGDCFGLKNFPVHMEVRVDRDGRIIPVEINPLRFAGWCTTDIAYYAYGINVYEYFMDQRKPEWDKILENREGRVYSIVIAEVPSGLNRNTIDSVDYGAFLKNFSAPLEVRRIDFREHPVFAFIFIETGIESSSELEMILREEMDKYIVMKG